MELESYLADCRDQVLSEIRSLIPGEASPFRSVLYDLMLEYPLRDAKALRPALCIACCRALGGRLEAVLPSAAVLEFYHNAFLIHDDIEDGSHTRRGGSTLHRQHGMPIAINVGDAMLALSLRPLLQNTRTIGLGKALRILEAIATMSEASVEGQALELDWIQRGRWDLGDSDYLLMVEKKTAWYSFVTPLQVAAIATGGSDVLARRLVDLGRALGLAFQIQDDLLNLERENARYGKEAWGDLWEGKRTLILLHLLRCLDPGQREVVLSILRKPRPGLGLGEGEHAKTAEEVEFLRELIDAHASIAHARRVAQGFAEEARTHALALREWMPPSVHREFLDSVVTYVHERDR